LYIVRVTDASGCEAEKSFNLPEPDPVQISYDIIANECTGSQDILVSAGGGSMNYTYLWSDGSTTNKIYNAEPGIHTITVTDTRLCTASEDIIVEEIQSQTLSCLINDPDAEVLCGSTNNMLSSSVEGAITYTWSVSSPDASWGITSSTNQDQIEYSAGSEGSTAIFMLTVTFEGGCEISCEMPIEACTITSDPSDEENNDSDNPDDGGTDTGSDGGSGDDSNDDTCECASENNNPENDTTENDNPEDEISSNDDCDDTENDGDDSGDHNDWDKTCDECFYTNQIAITKTYDGYLYSMEVNYDDCRYDLSHLTIEISECYKIVSFSNSMHWKMEYVKLDPTTGTRGIKIDDIPAFGKDNHLSSFTVNFKLTSYDSECFEELKCFSPVVAYKASTCVYEKITESKCADEDNLSYDIGTYPNPTSDYIKVDMRKCDKSVSYTADLFDFNGEKVCTYKIKKGYRHEFLMDLRYKKHGLYLLQMTSSLGKQSTHRIIKK